MTDNTLKKCDKHRVVFHGKAGEYFSIWLVNALLTAITLGIYSAWATVRRRRYFYGNTEINGDRFDYHAQPIQILKGRLLVAGSIIVFYILLAVSPLLGMAVLLVFLALVPWLVIRSWRYNAIMTSYRGVRFNYHCDTKRAYWALLFFPVLLFIGLVIAFSILGGLASSGNSVVLMLILALILVPAYAAANGVLKTMQVDLYVNNMQFGTAAFKAVLAKAAFIKMSLMSILLYLPFLIMAGSFAGSFFMSAIQGTMAGASDEAVGMEMLKNISNLIMAYVVLLVGVVFVAGYLVAVQRNYIYRKTSLAGNIAFHSSMQPLSYLALLLTNSLITVFSLGLAAPVAHVRHARYMANATAVEGDLSLLDVHAHRDGANSALAEEAVNALDLNVGI